MTGNKWDDNKIEELLGAMPAIQDKRPKSDILARLQQDERLNVPRRKKQNKWMPAFAAVAALLVIGLLLPSMLQQNEGAMVEDKSAADAEMAKNDSGEIAAYDESEETALFDGNSVEKEAAAFNTTRMVVSSHVVLPNGLEGMHAFRIGLTHAAEVIPVTLLISDQRISTDFPEGDPDSVALYNKYAADIPETELGFDDYHPYQGEIKLIDDTVVHTIPAQHAYDLSTATEGIYADSVLETFNDHAQFKGVDANGNQVVFSHEGVTQPKKLLGGKRPMPYYKYVMPTGQFYLVPAGGRQYDSASEALVNMKEQQGDLFESVIPESVTYDVREENGMMMIAFDSELDLSVIDPVEANAMIEGFMLTASNFNKQVRLENIMQDYFGNYDLTAVLPEPVGVNPTYLAES